MIQEERIEKAAKRLEQILKRIEPYTGDMRIAEYSTAGNWNIPQGIDIVESITEEKFFNALKKVAKPKTKK